MVYLRFVDFGPGLLSIPLDLLIPRRLSRGEETGWVLRFVPCPPDIGGDFAPWIATTIKRDKFFQVT